MHLLVIVLALFFHSALIFFSEARGGIRSNVAVGLSHDVLQLAAIYVRGGAMGGRGVYCSPFLITVKKSSF